MVQFELDINWPRSLWIGFGVVLVAATLYVLYSFVGTVVFGLFIYYATRRLHRRVSRRVRPPCRAAGLSLLFLALPALLLLYYTLAIALQELTRATTQLGGTNTQGQIGQYLDVIEPYVQLSAIVHDPASILTETGGIEALTAALQAALGYLGFLATGLLHLFIMFALAFYLLRDGPQLARWATNFTDKHGVLDYYFHSVDRSLDTVFYGNILNAIITGAIGAISFSLLNFVASGPVQIPYPALTGLLAGVASLIPIVGMKLVYVPVGVYLAALAALDGQGWWFVGSFVAVAFIVVDTIPDLVVRPYVSGGTLHVGALMFAYIFGPMLFGWYGIFLGPMLLVLVVHFIRIVLPELLAGTPIKPYSVDPSHIVSGTTRETDTGPTESTTGKQSFSTDGTDEVDVQTDSGA